MTSVKKQGPRVGLIDIETAPILAWVWGLFKQNISLEQIEQDWSILAVCFKWYNEKRVTYLDTSKQANIFDDKELILAVWKFLDEADVIVAQNGRRFDVKKINARFVEYGLNPPSPYKIVDTLEVAKSNFGFVSNKLQWMTKKLCKKVQKRSHEKFPGFKLWTAFIRRVPGAAKEMKLYNIDDVLSMEELYTIFLPWIRNHPNFGNYVEGETPHCTRCGSTHIVKNGTYYTEVGQYQKFRCGDCGGSLRGRNLINTKHKRQSLLMGV
jgi:hypothetical protein